MIGTASEEIARAQKEKVVVAPEILKKYAGVYDFRFPENPTVPMMMPFRFEGDTLFMGALPMIPVSQNVFMGPFGRIEFVTDANGVATHLFLRAAEGDLKATRVANATP